MTLSERDWKTEPFTEDDLTPVGGVSLWESVLAYREVFPEPVDLDLARGLRAQGMDLQDVACLFNFMLQADICTPGMVAKWEMEGG